ncbi:hypothetical protein L484_017675 [Morus notabilis]|uniref:TPX2 C-terminal domain-containing protein n=1 Tax=Morus notabilis TaxID=981085 RepID=W9SIZ9_9ROSA|nr:protein WVD2-like 7 [Morus notabilis]EXC31393.1 hypothetical protein L484_017675 [Morus notabilis]
MGETTCLMHVQQPFSYVSDLPNEPNEGNPIHGLGQSVSFGRFMSESLAWEKWSTFSHNRYVEEAERYSRPGSVAQKKAFFEAHYKNLAARKAAALLEQANAAASASSDQNSTAQDSDKPVSNSEVPVDEHELSVESRAVDHANDAKMDDSEQPVSVENVKKVEFLRDLNERTAKMEKSVSKKDQEKKKITVSSSSKSSTTKSAVSAKSSAKSAAPNATPLSKKPLLESADKKRSTPKSLHNKAVNFTPIREINRLTSTVIRKIDNSRFGTTSSKPTKDYCSTPLRTPITVSKNGTSQQTPCSANRRATTPVNNPSASGRTGPRWRLLATDCSKFLSACKNKTRSPFSYTPFSLRTEERAAKRKEKLEEKFNSNGAQKDQLKTQVKEKPETETGILRPGFCFKARPLPDFYKQRKAAENDDIKKVPLTHPQSPKLESKFTPSRVESRNPQTPKRPPVKNNGPKQVQGKNARSPTCSLISRATRTTTITHENRSPNIQHG